MTPEKFKAYRADICARQALISTLVESLEPASADAESSSHGADALAEALFLRAFTDYENDLERLFFHYLLGGSSLQGVAAKSYLRLNEEQIARTIVKRGFKYVSWAKPDAIRETASTFLEKGWPIVDVLAAQSQELADCERVRNRIAHRSTSATAEFNMVQRHLLSTERLFAITPGQLLRIRHKQHKTLHLGRFVAAMHNALEAIIDP